MNALGPFALLKSPTQRTVARLVADGFTDETISVETGIELVTVRYHIRRIAAHWSLDSQRNVRTQIARVVERAMGSAA